MGLKPLYIFDLDGTLALIDHRRHLVADKKNQRWNDFYRACVDDKPNIPVIDLLKLLIRNNNQYDMRFNDVYIFSGRSQLVKSETFKWLETHVSMDFGHGDNLWMRPAGNSVPDQILKKQWYDELPQQDKDRLVCVFDDRQKVVDMWRSIGVTCLQVSKGDF
jgi:hypothetical protein